MKQADTLTYRLQIDIWTRSSNIQDLYECVCLYAACSGEWISDSDRLPIESFKWWWSLEQYEPRMFTISSFLLRRAEIKPVLMMDRYAQWHTRPSANACFSIVSQMSHWLVQRSIPEAKFEWLFGWKTTSTAETASKENNHNVHLCSLTTLLKYRKLLDNPNTVQWVWT